MSWIITGTEKTPVEALEYLRLVELADGQALESGVRDAVIAFVSGCKTDGIWDAIKACCVLAGARTLNGALVPLVGTAPTNYNFVAGDYNRETGLVGDGSTKYLDSNRNNNADPQDSKHISVYASTKGFLPGLNAGYIGIGNSGTALFASGITQTRVFGGINGGTTFDPINIAPGFMGVNRNGSTSLQCRGGGSTLTSSTPSAFPASVSISIFRHPNYSNARISFYSIGESLDLALLDARVTTLMSDLAAAIP